MMRWCKKKRMGYKKKVAVKRDEQVGRDKGDGGILLEGLIVHLLVWMGSVSVYGMCSSLDQVHFHLKFWEPNSFGSWRELNFSL